MHIIYSAIEPYVIRIEANISTRRHFGLYGAYVGGVKRLHAFRQQYITRGRLQLNYRLEITNLIFSMCIHYHEVLDSLHKTAPLEHDSRMLLKYIMTMRELIHKRS